MASLNNHPSGCAKCAICPCRCCINKRTKCSRVKKALTLSNIQSDGSERRRRRLILVRHGTSQDEIDKRYSGWNDCDLSTLGIEQMRRAGQALRQANLSIDICFTSVLKRAIKSLFIIQEEMDYLWLPVFNTWRLNDRMLGTLTGFQRSRADALFGQSQLREWLNRPNTAPPMLEESNVLHPRFDTKYRNIYSIVPSTETLVDIRKRLSSFFYDDLFNNLLLGKNILVVTHEEIVKALICLLNNYAVDQFNSHEIPVGVPVVFEFASDENELINGSYLSSPLLDTNINSQTRLFPTGFADRKANSNDAYEEEQVLNINAKRSIGQARTSMGSSIARASQKSMVTLHPSDTKDDLIMVTDVMNTKHTQFDQTGPRLNQTLTEARDVPLTTGDALFELGMPNQPNPDDGTMMSSGGGAFSNNANTTTTSNKKSSGACKTRTNCCS